LVSASHTKINGLAPNSPVATVFLSCWLNAIAVISSWCLSKNVYVFCSVSITIPSAAAL